MPALPKGVILLWYGSLASIPSGFVLCDGTNDTPDLRDKFIVGAGSTYAVDDTGGSVNHNHTFTTDGHTHDIAMGANLPAGINLDDTTDPSTDNGTTDNGSSLPPYHSLAYIMKT